MNAERNAGGRGTLRLTPFRLYTVYVASAGVWLTGVLWLIYHYFMRQEGEFGLQNHPLESVWLSSHGVLSFVSVWSFGMLWAIHVVRGWNADWRRWSGGSLVAAALILSLTGLGLYYVGSTQWQSWISLAHWILGIVTLPLFFLHWLSKAPARSAP